MGDETPALQLFSLCLFFLARPGAKPSHGAALSPSDGGGSSQPEEGTIPVAGAARKTAPVTLIVCGWTSFILVVSLLYPLV